MLFVRGELQPTDAVALAIVGSRQATIYGGEQSRRFGELLAGAGFTVVSGLARGIDAMAHHGAVAARGRTIAVLGSGLSEIYPPENQPLADQIVECGALLSELPMTIDVRPGNFPSRNRIIAGLSLGVLVVEAAKRSGALITARLATDYNRDVFALPGRAEDPMSQGTNRLIRDSHAKLTVCLDDILDELGTVADALRRELAITEPLLKSDKPAANEAAAELGDLFSQQASAAAVGEQPATDSAASTDTAQAAPLDLSPAERAVYDNLTTDPVYQDALLAQLALPPGEALAAFTTLELKGLIKRLPGHQLQRRV